jgi:leucyl-tRNA synthetase
LTSNCTTNYEPDRIEQKWQSFWKEKELFKTPTVTSATNIPSKERKFYCLEMFPYPSGRIHMGHVRNYAIGDVIARYKRMRGYHVLHPMGWDAFGLPAENAAIKHGVHPAKWTYENIKYMKDQLERLGLSYDWNKEITTCTPEYYKWNQWFFLKMLEKGLAYRKASFVNWCPSCETVLANEQVIDGKCWRCDSSVTQKELEQWFLKITAYAEELLRDLDTLKGWPEKVITMQKNWIGKSEGAEVRFRIDGMEEDIIIFTTRPDTLWGCTFVCLAPNHPLSEILMRDKNILKELTSFYGDPLTKLGHFTGYYAINPVNNRKVPIYIANFVLMEYGTGAIMSVPAHDQRDFDFAKKYGLPVEVVIVPEKNMDSQLLLTPPNNLEKAYEGEGYLINSGEFTGLHSSEARERIIQFLEERGIGKRKVNYKLRDWGISRQRYWGTPIPVLYCDRCGIVPVPEKDLPVVLPEDVEFTGKGSSPLAKSPDFVKTKCPRCGEEARRETDTMDTFVDSSWYFLAYCIKNKMELDPTKEGAKKEFSYWMPVDQYIGGIEHAVLHLLYSRFFTKVLRDLGIVNLDEPFQNLLTQGMVCMETFRCPDHGWLFPDEVKEDKCIHCGKAVERGRVEKMSKSKKNIVDPDELIKKYGADTIRLFSLFAAPPEKDLEWSSSGVEGIYRFLGRLWNFVQKWKDTIKEQKSQGEEGNTSTVAFATNSTLHQFNPNCYFRHQIVRLTHRTIKRVTEDIEKEFHFNTAIARLMEFLNELQDFSNNYLRHEASTVTLATKTEEIKALKFAIENLLLLLSPFAPHIAEELWAAIGNKPSIIEYPWPEWDEELAKEEEYELVIQINGKVRAKVLIPQGLSEEAIKERALSEPKIKQALLGKEIKNIIVAKKKLVNIVI